MLALSLPMKNRKGLTQDVTDMCATLVCLVHDVKDTQHKIAVLTAVFYQLSNVDFEQTGPDWTTVMPLSQV